MAKMKWYVLEQEGGTEDRSEPFEAKNETEAYRIAVTDIMNSTLTETDEDGNPKED